jgi:cell division protein FtsI (penicillin-binding protein 3)
MRTVLRPVRLGDILDENGTPLVTSVSKFDIYMDPTVPKQEDFDRYLPDLCRGLHKMFPDVSAREFEMKIRRGRAKKVRYLLVRKKVSNAERKFISELPLFNLGRFKGGFIDSEQETIRKRPHGEMLKRTLGYYKAAEGKHSELRVGIEGAYYDYLAGEPGQEVEQRLSTGWKKTGKIVNDGIEGANIITSFDNEIQEVAHNELNNQLLNFNALSGSVIVMDVKTGFIKAMANLTRTEDGTYHELYNHAIGTKEVPGSTFKLASLMAALDDGKIKLTDSVTARPEYSFYGVKLTEAKKHNYGRITIKEAFEKSSNVIGKIIFNAYKDNPKQFVDHLKSFGLNLPLGLDISGEASPIMYEPGNKNWWAGSLAWMAVGYDIQLTPMQTLTFYNAVANNGKMVKPQFVKEIIRGNEVVKKFEPIVLKEKICTDKTLALMQDCLYGVMKEGTGKYLTSSYFEIAGKTGTAQVLNDNNRYGVKGEDRYLASFVGYFPVENPIYSCIVTITANGDNIYGASVSGKVFSAIANKVYASHLKYHGAVNETKLTGVNLPTIKTGNAKEISTILNYLNIPYELNQNEEWVTSEPTLSKITLHEKLIGKGLVPNVIGMTAKDAVFLLESAGLFVKIEGYGKVRSQSIPAKEPAAKYSGSLITLILN